MKLLFILFFCCMYVVGYTQISAPDTVCAGTAVHFTTPPNAVMYGWDFSPITVIQPISPLSAYYTCPTGSTPAWATFNNDSGNYYTFITNYFTQKITRLSYGTNIYSTPVTTDLGSFSATGGELEGLDIVKDSATGKWYGLAVNFSQLLVLSFGSSLSSTPTVTVTTYPSIKWGTQITIKRYHGSWIAFLGNRNSNITRFDFGSLLTNTPTVTDIPNVGSVAYPDNFTLYEQSGNWYMLITDLIDGTLSRYDFGSDLLNNAPTGTLLTSPSGLFDLPRPVNLLNDCNGNLIGYIANETGNLIKLDFGGDITSTPTYTSLGASGIIDINSATPCAFKDSFFFLLVDYAGSISKYNPLEMSPADFINYYDSSQTYTFAAPGTYNVTLFEDMGFTSGPSVFCKTITVISCVPDTVCNTLSMPDSLYACTGASDTLRPTVIGSDSIVNILWSPSHGLSDTNILDPVLTVGASGWYYLTVSSVLPGGTYA